MTDRMNALPLYKHNIHSVTNNSTQHCVIHIHGLHHSGTGFTRQVVFDSLGGESVASKHQDTRVTQDEGQHLQRVYPNFRKRLRFPKICGADRPSFPTTLHELYTCPQLLELFPPHNRTVAQRQLHQQWSRRWDTTKPYLLQKTPTFDVVLLETLKLYPTVHVVVMRHPWSWTKVLKMLNPRLAAQFQEHPMYLAEVWWNVWIDVLEQLSQNGLVESFLVVNYEVLLLHQERASREMSLYIQSECNLGRHDNAQEEPQQHRRRLHMYTNATNDVSHYLVPKAAVDAFQKCQQDDPCKAFMTKTASVLQEFGYAWNPETSFQLPNSNSMLFFTSKNPPPMKLIERMKQVAVE